MIAITIFFLFLNEVLADYKFLYLATKNISEESFVAHTKHVKISESRLTL